jgi:hypothetical protein
MAYVVCHTWHLLPSDRPVLQAPRDADRRLDEETCFLVEVIESTRSRPRQPVAFLASD